MDSPADASENLVERVQNLPQELQDMIFDFTTESPKREIRIDWLYRPPSYLQINRATRDKAAKNYYNNTCFLVKGVLGRTCTHIEFTKQAWKWLASLPTAHFQQIGEVRILGFADSLRSVCDHDLVTLEDSESIMSGQVGATLHPEHMVIRWEFSPIETASRSETVWYTLQELTGSYDEHLAAERKMTQLEH